MQGVLLPAFVYLCAALVAVPLAGRAGLGSVLGYLAAGVLIGPILGLAGDAQSLQGFAELGVVMMLFLVGLALEPRLLWRMRGQLAGLGGLQVAITCLLLAGAGAAVGLAWSAALTVGMILAMSSTAIVLQTLKEKGYLRTEGGQAGFAVLLFQDIAVIPILALIPLLGHGGAVGGAEGHAAAPSLVAGLPGWAAALATLGAVAVLVLGGQYLARPLFRFIARAGLREVFTAAALAVVIGCALLMTAVGLSPALGAFLAGVVLATSEFRHELESDIEPFKGLLLGLFFITVGAGIDFRALSAAPGLILAVTLGLILVKAAVLWGLGTVFRLRGSDRLLFALGLAQAGEFGFVLISFSRQAGAIDAGLAGTLSLAVTLSMLATPLLFLAYERISVRGQVGAVERDPDEITERGTVIIAGLGRFGQVVNRILLSNGYRTVVLDHQAEHVDEMRRFGVRGFYGDATRPDLLHAAGLAEAKVLVVAIDDPERTLELVKFARRARPDIHIVARAFDRVAVYALFQAGANDIVREVFDSSVRAGRCALEGLGIHPFRAQKLVEAHVRFDRESMRMLAEVWDPEVSVFENPAYIRIAAERSAELERAMMGDRGYEADRPDRAWTPPATPEGQAESA
ncbi:MAG: monovalent cation:proton antiporter-2 (CPA2) family protein [Amaricoccus sp.]